MINRIYTTLFLAAKMTALIPTPAPIYYTPTNNPTFLISKEDRIEYIELTV
jgi:hypothetical protein